MSIELLPPTPIWPSEYHVRPNHCNCHVETCNCDDWAVYCGAVKGLTFNRKEDAVEWANFKNKDNPHVPKNNLILSPLNVISSLQEGFRNSHGIIHSGSLKIAFYVNGVEVDPKSVEIRTTY